jgi:hypothetical protein
MPLEWTHQKCGPVCLETTESNRFPTVLGRIAMVRSAYVEYSEKDGTGCLGLRRVGLRFNCGFFEKSLRVPAKALCRRKTDRLSNNVLNPETGEY